MEMCSLEVVAEPAVEPVVAVGLLIGPILILDQMPFVQERGGWTLKGDELVVPSDHLQQTLA